MIEKTYSIADSCVSEKPFFSMILLFFSWTSDVTVGKFYIIVVLSTYNVKD